MYRVLLLFLVFLAGCQQRPSTVVSAPPFEPDTGSLVVYCGTLIDGIADEPSHDQVVIIRDGRFESVGDGDMDVGLPLLDLSRHTCMPGLINTHVHLADFNEWTSDYTIYYRMTDAELLQQATENATRNLLTGFTTVRNTGDYFPHIVYEVRDRIRSGTVIGPRIQTAGPYLTIPGGGGDLVLPDHDESEIPAAMRKGVAATPAEFANAARRAIDGGAEFLKVIASGAVFSFGTEPGAPEMGRDDIEAVVGVAREHGLKVTAHVHSDQSGRDAILAGVDSIEHASLLEDDTIALAAEHKVAFSMDVYNGTYTEEVGRDLGYPEHIMQRNHDTTEAQRVVFEKAYAHGIPILYGTDAGVLPHDMGGWQFGIMVERGMVPMDAMRSAMSVAAEQMGWEDKVGAIRPGLYGDLVAVKGNPLNDPDVMQDVQVVIKGGHILKRPGT